MRAFAVAVVVCLSLAFASVARAQAEEELAERYAPVVRLVEQEEECGPGEPYEPIDIDAILDEETVSLRGPWRSNDLVTIAPSADDLGQGLYEYNLDFPGDALNPGCTYERWARRVTADTEPTVYAHVATEAAYPDRLALQYWFYYPYNDWNNLHEGDWEMIQLVFAAASAEEALAEAPLEVGYSQHEGGERADWGDEKLEVVAGTHPVVYPAAGSHANFYSEGLFLGRSAAQGVGCDDTTGPSEELRPVARSIPNDPEAGREAFPWIAFEGRWGERQEAFYNGPTGPSMKRQWTQPISWSAGWRDRSYAVPTSGAFGTGATDFFCRAVAQGSSGLIRLLRSPEIVLLAIALLLAIVLFAIQRATWTPVASLRIARRRHWGQLLSAAGVMYVKRLPLFLGIGVLLIPIAVLTAILQSLVVSAFALAGVEADGETAGAFALLSLAIGTTLTLVGLALVQAATACALVEIDKGRSVGPVGAYRRALTRIRPLLAALGLAVAAWVALTATGILLPVAIWLAVRWSLFGQVVELEDRSALDALRRSAELVRGRWLRVASLVGLGAVLALGAGPLIGALLILLTDAPLPLLNVVAGVIYSIAIPFVAVTTTYVYMDARTRVELEPADELDELPAEIQLSR
jgi:hypothetical protein